MAAETNQRSAITAGVVCYLLWGFLPLYFHVVSLFGVSSFEMIAHRTVWAVIWAGGLVLLARQAGEVKRVLGDLKIMAWLAASTLAIFINWTVYVLAVNAGHVIEASLGYYINPLMNMAAGALLFRERMSGPGKVAIGLAAIGVVVQAIAIGHLPIVSLGLAMSFCAYAVIRKRVAVDAQTGLFFECAYLALPGLLYVLWLQKTGVGHFTGGWNIALLLMAAGPATVAPLALFAWAARRMPLSTMGFLQFLAPTIQFLIGVALGEAFTPLRALSFGFIWAGVAVFAYGAWQAGRRARLAQSAA
ncbi:EamA family transporter RarD [Caulobacter segnis]|uniref:EamA family transporter RarD n=1 Tax=Caulobacter segnis TaxID=88688 RepID=UPI00241076A7|nr:EamA family transporter RarD [Caulobacter segnis]MDG2521101.1 EamA family transporter RarD [Caulobacter segnis]